MSTKPILYFFPLSPQNYCVKIIARLIDLELEIKWVNQKQNIFHSTQIVWHFYRGLDIQNRNQLQEIFVKV